MPRTSRLFLSFALCLWLSGCLAVPTPEGGSHAQPGASAVLAPGGEADFAGRPSLPSAGGNGEIVSGGPNPQDYGTALYEFDPGYRCREPDGSLVLSYVGMILNLPSVDRGIYGDLCSSRFEPRRSRVLADESSFRGRLYGYGEGIYRGFDRALDSAEALEDAARVVTTVWCRTFDENTDTLLELFVDTEAETGTWVSSAQIVWKEPDGAASGYVVRQTPPFPVGLIREGGLVQIDSPFAFTATIHPAKHSTDFPYHRSGVTRFRVDDKPGERALACRLTRSLR